MYVCMCVCLYVCMSCAALVLSSARHLGDGGYKQTSRMVCEAGICIALMMADGKKKAKKQVEGGEKEAAAGMYGVLTPSTALGTPFLDRLRDSPGITFPLEE